MPGSSDSQPTQKLNEANGITRGAGLGKLVRRLPSTLAIVIDEYLREADDYRALHRICSALEITARFLVIIVLAELWTRRVAPDAGFPDMLLKQLLQHLERPTLGGWKVLMEVATDALPGKKLEKQCLLPELPRFVEKFVTALGSGNGDPLKKLLPMRNLLAHGGRISGDLVVRLLKAHAKTFEDLMADLSFLSGAEDVALVASPAVGPALLLRGPDTSREEFDLSRLPEEFRPAGPDRMLLITPNRILDLCPLHAYGEVFRVVNDELQGDGEKAIHIYARAAEPGGIEYTALGARSSNSRGAPALERSFAEIFPLEMWRARFRTEDALAKYTFQGRMDGLLRLFIGRDKQAEAAAKRIDAISSGIVWLAGKPGMGKSAFMAKLVRDNFQRQSETADERTDLICIPYFFQSSDSDRCRTVAFAEAGLLRLARATSRDIRLEDDPEKRLNQFKKVLEQISLDESKTGHRKIVILLDGLDEVMSDDTSVVELIFDCQFPSVVWVCAGRDEAPLCRAFNHERCTWLFERNAPSPDLVVQTEEEEGLLPALNSDNVRGFFIEELGHRLLQFFGRDDKKPDGHWSNHYVEEVVRRSGGLPIYLQLLVQDIRAGRIDFTPHSEQRIPRSLEEYYDRIVTEMGDDLSATVPAMTSLLALAAEPLPFETLLALLKDHELVGQPDGGDLLDEAIRRSSVMLRRARTSAGFPGYILYHESFRQHILKSQRIRRCRTKAFDRLCSLILNWSKLEAGTPARDYALRYGPLTLNEGQRHEAARELLLSFDWLQAKLEAAGAYLLITDFDYFADDLELWLVQSAIRLSAHVLAFDVRQLAGQIIGRLLGRGSGKISALLKRAADWRTSVWLRPLTSTLTPAGGPLIRILQGHNSGVQGVSIVPDGHRAISASLDGTLRVWDLASGQSLRTLRGHEASVNDVVVTLDGRRAVSASSDKTLRVWDLKSGETSLTFRGHTHSIEAVAIVPDGRRVVSASVDKTLRVWDLVAGQCLGMLQGHGESVSAVAITPDGRRAVSSSWDNTLRVWDLESGQTVRILEGHSAGVTAVAVTPDGRRAVSADCLKLRVWSLETGECLRVIDGPTLSCWVDALAITPDGRRAVWTAGHFALGVWDLESGRCLQKLPPHMGHVRAVAITPDGRRAVSASDDKALRIWGLEVDQPLSTSLCAEPPGVNAIVITPDGSHAVSASGDGILRVWDVENGRCLRQLDGHSDSVNAVAITPHGDRLVSASSDWTLRIWDLESGECLNTLRGHFSWIGSVAITPDERRVVSASHDHSLRVWDLANGECLHQLEGHSDSVSKVAITQDGRWAVSVSWDKTLRVWDLESGQCLRTLQGHGEYALVNAVAITPDGRHAVSADDSLWVWDLQTGQCLRILKGHNGSVKDVTITADGRKAVSASYDDSLRVWDLQTGQCLHALRGHRGTVNQVAIAIDGCLAVSASGDATLRVWNLERGEEVATFTGEYNMSCCAFAPDGKTIVGGDWSGAAHFCQLEGMN